MKKIILFMAAVAAALMLTACGADPAEEREVPTFGSGKPEATEPTEAEFKPGDFVWCVWHPSEDGLDPAQAVRYKVVAVYDTEINVTNRFHEDEMGYDIYTFPIEDCYRDESVAEAVAEAENRRADNAAD